uniref:Uncharacterized protein n=1 Tax=Anguilla anguilla TaxID=7936 RepID=A0A0E9SZ80_ANGAN
MCLGLWYINTLLSMTGIFACWSRSQRVNDK